MCEVVEVDRKTKTVTFRTSAGSVMIYKNKIISKMGEIPSAEMKKCHRKYHAIMNMSKHDKDCICAKCYDRAEREHFDQLEAQATGN